MVISREPLSGRGKRMERSAPFERGRLWSPLPPSAATRRRPQRCRPNEDRRDRGSGSRKQSFNYAVDRAKRLTADLRPLEAMKRGVYWFWPRAKRRDMPTWYQAFGPALVSSRITSDPLGVPGCKAAIQIWSWASRPSTMVPAALDLQRS